MKNNKANTLPSLESFDDEVAVGLDHTDALDYGSSEVDAYAREATIDGRDLENQLDSVEGGIADMVSVESLIEAIDQAREVGLEMGSAQFMQIHLQTFQQRYGIESLETALPALESFHERRARMATSISLESAKETLKKIWLWIREQVAKFAELLMTFFRKMTRSLDYIAKEADTLKQKARHSKFEGGKKIDLGRAASKISHDGVVSKEFITPLNFVGQLTAVSQGVFQDIHKEVDVVLKKAAELKADTNFEDYRKDVLQYAPRLPVPSSFRVVSDTTAAEFDAVPSKLYGSQALPGDRVIYVATYGSDDRAQYRFNDDITLKAQVTVRSLIPVREINTHAESLSSSEIFTLCQRLQKTVAALKTHRDQIESEFKKIRARVDQVGSHELLADESGVKAAAIRKVLTMVLKMVTSYGGQLYRTCDQVAFDVCAGYLTYAKRSMVAAETSTPAVEAPALPAAA